MCTHNLCFEKNMKIIKKFQLKIVIFTAVKYCCILHGRVFVMHPKVIISLVLTYSQIGEIWGWHYDNMPLQYTAIFTAAKMTIFS